MRKFTRRAFLAAAASAPIGASFVQARSRVERSRLRWVERRDLFAEGVGSGDPGVDSVLPWTRVSRAGSVPAVPLTVEVADDPAFERVVAVARTRARAAADHTCRVLVGGLRPARIYWYRFATHDGLGSRIGRTRTAAALNDPRAVRFAFVSCQNVCEGAQNAYRRMIFEDEQAAPDDQLAFILHLGEKTNR
jgi:alkaline phosphatase D